MNKVAISQSNYIPWKGYFDLIASVDIFVVYDDMQYTRRDWRNRNKIKTELGSKWLTIPVEVKGKYLQKINETHIADPGWTKKHWAQLHHNYKFAPFFDEISDWLEPLYLKNDFQYLTECNLEFIKAICSYLGISTCIRQSSEFDLIEGKTERLVDLCLKLDGHTYVSGPAARKYMDVALFEENNIRVEWAGYSNYREYNQLFTPFEHEVTILDLLFNEGSNASEFMKYCQ